MYRLIFHFILCLALAPIAAHADSMSIEDAFSPHQGATDLIIKTIDGAQSTIQIAAYGFTSKPIAEALIAAHKRGVDVKAVVDMKANRRSGVASLLLANGIPVRLNGHYAILHDKFMIVDKQKLELGSFNYTRSAEVRNAENVLVIASNDKLVHDYMRQWSKLWNEAEAQVTVSDAEQISASSEP